MAVQGSALFHKPASYYTEAPWRHRAGGGLILLNLVGEIDNLRLLGGEIEAVQALASNARAVATRSKTRWQSRCTSPTARSGLPAVRRGREHRSWEQTSGANPACARDPAEACCLVSGDRGTLALPSLRRQTVTGEPSWTTPMSERTLAVVATDPLQRQLSTSPR